jgi:hypothetical protein
VARALSAAFVESTSRPRWQASSASGILSSEKHADAERYHALMLYGLSRNVDAQSMVQER